MFQVPGDKVNGGVGLLGDAVDLFMPFQVVIDGDAKVFSIGLNLKDITKKVI